MSVCANFQGAQGYLSIPIASRQCRRRLPYLCHSPAICQTARLAPRVVSGEETRVALLTEDWLTASHSRSRFHTWLAILVLLAGVPVLVGSWALLSPNLVVSHPMTWDFLYNLSGACHLQHGHVAHIDFHEPVGQLNFSLTLLGFKLFGPTPFAFLVCVTIVAIPVFVSAVLATMRRLPLVPAALFLIFVSLLRLMPAGAGDLPHAYSFAIPYNRYGWSLFSILARILVLPPKQLCTSFLFI